MVEGSAATSFSRDKIDVEQLQNLKERFEDDLNEKEFVDLFIEIIDSSLSETQLTHLYVRRLTGARAQPDLTCAL